MAHEKQRGVVYPTHTCFDDAFEIVARIALKEKARAERLLIVHAICLLADGKPGAHAWVEEGSKCLFAGIYQGKKVFLRAYRKEYYAEICPQEMTKYTVQEALAKGIAEGRRTGPWEARYLVWTRERKEGSDGGETHTDGVST